jgi:hypothetical protein
MKTMFLVCPQESRAIAQYKYSAIHDPDPVAAVDRWYLRSLVKISLGLMLMAGTADNG